MRTLFFSFCSVLLFLACGSDEIPEPVETKPNYFPDSIGSRWVYRKSDGQEWTQEIIEVNDNLDNHYQTFKYTPSMSKTVLDFLTPTSFHISQNHVLYFINDNLNHYIQTELLSLVQDDFIGLDIKVVPEPIQYPDLIILQLPLTLDLYWDAFHVEVQGSFILQDLTLLQIHFDAIIDIKAEVLGIKTVNTPAGSFDDTYKIEFQIDISHTVLSDEDSSKHMQSIWFTPHVGIVKIMNHRGVSELVEYTLK